MNYINLRDTVIGGGIGYIYGFAISKSGCHRPSVIRDQFELKDFRLLKTFGTAAATGLVSTAIMHKLGYVDITIKPTYLWGNIIGGAVVGLGTYIAGSSAEVAPIQAGAGKQKALIMIAGGFLGTLAYGIAEKSFSTSILGNPGDICALHRWLGADFSVVAISLAGVIAGGLYFLEQMFPTFVPLDDKSPLEKGPETIADKLADSVKKQTWSPYVSGAIIGMLQIPTSLFMNGMFGATSLYGMLAGHVISLFTAPNYFFITQMTRDKYWYFPLHLGSFFGSYTNCAVTEKKQKQRTVKEISSAKKVLVFLGSFIITFGTGIANGSPSVHGLSGISQLSCGSYISVLSMFGGGILGSHLLKAQIRS